MKIDRAVRIRVFAPHQQPFDLYGEARLFETLPHRAVFRRFALPTLASWKFGEPRERHIGTARADEKVTSLFDDGDADPLDVSRHDVIPARRLFLESQTFIASTIPPLNPER